eukprot:7382235-Prymnesium_polylepis.1
MGGGEGGGGGGGGGDGGVSAPRACRVCDSGPLRQASEAGSYELFCDGPRYGLQHVGSRVLGYGVRFSCGACDVDFCPACH